MKLQRQPSKKKQVSFYSVCALCVLLLLTGCSKVLHWSKAEPRFYSIDSSAVDAVDTAVMTMIAPYSNALWSEMNEVIGQNVQTLVRERPEGTLNNWVADVIKSETERYSGTPVDFGVSNYGGIRINTVAEGPVTLGKIYEVMPFDNILVIMPLKGANLKTFLDDMAENGGWPISRELRFTITDSIATDITINGQPFDPEKEYRVAMPDYIANGGDGRDYLRMMPRSMTGYLVRDALINHLRALTAAGQFLVVEKDGRVKIAVQN